MPSFDPGLYTLIPRDDGSHANDWVTDEFLFAAASGASVDWVHGSRRAAMAEVRIELYDGSGINTWTVRPVQILDSSVPSDSRVIFDDERPCAVGVAPLSFAKTGLPIQRLFSVPVRMGACALRFARSGAGTSRLRVRLFSAGGR
jgi:hypothetical protein